MTGFPQDANEPASKKNDIGMKPFFSIIVPAYNVEDYLNECIDSILANSLTDYEIVLVDDGSFDNTSYLVDEWAKRDVRIKAIHQENGGLSAARNAGIAVARGRYVIFLDADDCLAPWALSGLSDSICETLEPDIIITEMTNVHDMSHMPSKDSAICISTASLGKDEAFRYVFAEKPHTWPAPQYPIKRTFIEKSELLFVHGLLHEDVCWTAEAMTLAESFAAYRHPWYIRRCGRYGSIMNSVSARHITDTVQAVCEVLQSSGFSRLTDSQADLLRSRLALSLFPPLRQYGKLNDAEKAAVVTCVEENLALFALSRKPVHRLFVMACKTFGTRQALRLVLSR